MTGAVKISGIEHVFGDRAYTIPPLSLGALERLQGKLQALQDETNPLALSSVSTVVDAAHAALLRNYPEISREEVAELVDVSNMHEIVQKVLDVAGVLRKETEGKARAAATPAAPPPSPT